MHIDSFVRKTIALLLSLSLFAPLIAFAQTLPEVPTTQESSPAIVVESVSESVVADTSTSSEAVVTAPDPVFAETVQDTAPTQETAQADVLEETANPEASTSTENQIIAVAESTTTEAAIDTIPVSADSEPVVLPEEIPVAVETLTIVESKLESVVETVAEDFVPLRDSNDSLDPEYVMSLSGTTIPTVKEGALSTAPVTAAAHVEIDSVDGSLRVSGACSNVYFVVLLFKNQSDYDTDPASYIVNRAYPCVNGNYSYDINNLPTTIQNGTYYLLIGEQGERGSWSPVTALTAIDISRN
jgi:hypothetical protein